MGSRFVRKVRTASGAVAVQVVRKDAGRVVEVEHLGSAHTDEELGLLLEAAERVARPGQDVLDVGPVERLAPSVGDVADWTGKGGQGLVRPAGRRRVVNGGAQVVGTASLTLWRVLEAAYRRLGFDAVGDDVFAKIVLARITEPTSKADALRVLDDLGVRPPSLRSVFNMLDRCQARDYRDTLARCCQRHSAATSGMAGVVLYDVTTLHFETDDEDEWRKVGLSKEHRVDPQIQVGLLVDAGGFPLEVGMFPGNKAETTTLIPVLDGFKARHGVEDVVVVADAGMLSAANLNALEDAGYRFIVGSRITKAPYDLADHFKRHGDYFDDGQVLESARVMGQGKTARERRVVYQWLFKRYKKDNKSINKQIDRAERIASGQATARNARFLKVTGARRSLNQATIDRARQLAGLKGYVTNVPAADMDGRAVITAYHDLYQVEASFRVTKSDLRARPTFHWDPAKIDAHLTIVFAALAISRHLQNLTGLSIKKIVHTLRPIRSADIDINGNTITIDPRLPDPIRQIIQTVTDAGH